MVRGPFFETLLDPEAYFRPETAGFLNFGALPVQSSRYLKLVRASAAYDLLVTWPFATPWTFSWLYAQLADVAQALQLPGAVHPLDATHLLFANLLGSVVVVWSLARLWAPSEQLGRLDALARVLFAAWQVYAVMHGASAIVLGFTAFELLFGVLQSAPVRDNQTPDWGCAPPLT
jgi:hypothetical protein